MPVTYIPLATQTLGSSATTVTFSSISGSYTDIIVVIDATSAGDNVLARVNGDTGTNYSFTRLSGNGSTATSARGSNASYLNFDGAAYLTTGRSTWVIQFMNYSNTTTNKTVLSRGSNAAVGTDANVNLWRSTSAINSISFIATSNNFAIGSTFSLYGIASTAASAKATGGDLITSDGTYYYHTFTSSGTFTPLQALTCDYLVVAGGGGGGERAGGGGGGGGLRSTVTATGGGGSLESALSLASGTGYTVTIGAGGTAGTVSAKGGTGSNSVFSTITSNGGGGGGTAEAATGLKNATNGGSGGGSAAYSGAGTVGTGTANQGFNGGTGIESAPYYGGGGGGGAGSVGSNGTSTVGGAGGSGVATSITGSSVTRAGGGGGGTLSGGTGGTASGGGGAGGSTPAAGTANTGGGGGAGGGDGVNGAAGGSGLVIVRYPI